MQDSDSPKAFIARVGNALLRLLAMMILGGTHWLLEQGVPYIVPENVKEGRMWIQDVSFCAFSLIYVYLLWDTIKVFVPWLQRRTYPKLEVKDEAS